MQTGLPYYAAAASRRKLIDAEDLDSVAADLTFSVLPQIGIRSKGALAGRRTILVERSSALRCDLVGVATADAHPRPDELQSFNGYSPIRT
jgi:hypothetical protein